MIRATTPPITGTTVPSTTSRAEGGTPPLLLLIARVTLLPAKRSGECGCGSWALRSRGWSACMWVWEGDEGIRIAFVRQHRTIAPRLSRGQT
jgi:hypothetical protein